MKIEIKHRWSGVVLFSAEVETLRLALEAAVKSRANLREADLCGANMDGADLRGANLRGANLHRADLCGAYLRAADLDEAELCEANLCEANLREANLRVAYLRGADLRGAYLDEAELRGAYLCGANLREADLCGANLCEANLCGANLREANLRGAYLRGANLREANLHEANLRGADLCGAYLRAADLCGAKGLSKYRVTPLLMLLDQPGPIRAYKLVNGKHEGPIRGGLKYQVGETVEVPVADTDEFKDCAKGINLATLDWCIAQWRPGYRILVAEFTARDIAAIPTATDGKFRVRCCQIVGEKDLVEIGLETKGG